MKDNATLVAILGVIIITLAVIISSGLTRQAVDSELIKQVVTGLLGFSSGVGASMVVSALKSNKIE